VTVSRCELVLDDDQAEECADIDVRALLDQSALGEGCLDMGLLCPFEVEQFILDLVEPLLAIGSRLLVRELGLRVDQSRGKSGHADERPLLTTPCD
jgi:hypothetical protein